MEGRKIEAPKPPEPTKPPDLMEALRQSAEEAGARAAKPKRRPGAAKPKTTKRKKAA
jgi:non-homologous end joining protein Ku